MRFLSNPKAAREIPGLIMLRFLEDERKCQLPSSPGKEVVEVASGLQMQAGSLAGLQTRQAHYIRQLLEGQVVFSDLGPGEGCGSCRVRTRGNSVALDFPANLFSQPKGENSAGRLMV